MDRTEVLAIEIKHYEGDRGRVLVPRVLGQTAAARNRKGDSPRQKREWDEASFIEDLERRSNRDASDVARHLIEWSRSRFGEPVWGSGAKNGFFSAPLRHDGFRHALFDIGTAGGLYIRFQRLARRGPFEDETLRTDLMHRFNQIPGVHFEKPEGWPEIPIDVLASPSALEQFKKTIEYIADEIQQY